MPRPIFTLLAELQSTLAELAEVLNPLKDLVGSFGGDDRPSPQPPATRRRGPGTKTIASTASTDVPALTASKSVTLGTSTGSARALQGKYMSAIRRLSKADQVEVKRVRGDHGIEAAIRVALERAA